VADARGLLPQALQFRERREEISRRLQSAAWLAFDLTNHADLLIRLGRFSAAESLLRETEEGAAKGIQAYVGRRRRVSLLRARAASIQLRFTDAEARALDVIAASAGRNDGTRRF